jgi:transcription-repair coupling factor (superfamily II helicase)
MGARDLSVIETAPMNRRPIQTIIKNYEHKTVVEAIRKEKARGGQVFYLHNRVQTIDAVEARLQDLMPEITFAVAHGQMPEGVLERMMNRFVEGKYDVLISTTIIESGLDIPNANTIIIEAADRFGLAQLYQIRGRVGRFNRQAYAYLLLHRHAKVLEMARKRLAALKQYNQLGAGFRIAMRDLELRGAGNLLGAEQSGHIAGVGFDLYCQLLKQSIARLKGDEAALRIRANVRLDFVFVGEQATMNQSITHDSYQAIKNEEIQATQGRIIEAFIPPGYLDEARLRIEVYRELAMADSLEALKEIEDSLVDRFGDFPDSVKALIQISKVRTLAEEKGIDSVESEGNRLKCRLAGHKQEIGRAHV